VSGVVVARPKTDCKVCQLKPEQRQEVNAAVWDGTARRPRYREAGKRAYESFGGTINVKAITRHADHTEDGWREATPDDPAAGRERPVFASDYESLTERAAIAGAQALNTLEQRVALGEIDNRELLGLAKLGLGARQKQEELRAASNRPEIALTAIIGIASGHVQLPESEVIEVVDPQELKATVQEERRLLEARAARVSED
jgi:hypothetical protein